MDDTVVIDEELSGLALLDLNQRARGGTLIYLPLWLVMTLPFGLADSHAQFFFVNTLLILATTSLRLWCHSLSKEYLLKNRRLLEGILTATVLWAALHWGVLTALVLFDPSLQAMRPVFVTAAPGFAAAGACTMSMSSLIRIGFPIFVLVPGVVACLVDGSQENLLNAMMALLFTIYITLAARTMHGDYWRAMSNQKLSELRAEEMLLLSITDSITRLKNRMYFDHQYVREWRRAVRGQSSIAVLMLDLDKFKEFNDNYGHLAGDECLRMVARAMEGVIQRPGDFVARYGGEEFVMVLPDTSRQGAKFIAEKVLDVIAGGVDVGNERV